MTNFQIEEAILDIVDHADEMTRSDLQGVVSALVLNIARPFTK